MKIKKFKKWLLRNSYVIGYSEDFRDDKSSMNINNNDMFNDFKNDKKITRNNIKKLKDKNSSLIKELLEVSDANAQLSQQIYALHDDIRHSKDMITSSKETIDILNKNKSDYEQEKSVLAQENAHLEHEINRLKRTKYYRGNQESIDKFSDYLDITILDWTPVNDTTETNKITGILSIIKDKFKIIFELNN